MTLYVVIALVVFFLMVLLWIAWSSRSHKRHASTANLIGSAAVVDQPLNPKGSVIVDGEIWLALSESGAHVAKSASVKVIGVKDQFLVVR